MLPAGERLDSTLKFIQRSQARIEKIQAELRREQTLLHQALGSLARMQDKAANSVSEPPHNSRWMSRTQKEEIRRLRAQVAELQHERVVGHEILSTPALELAPLHSGAARSRSASNLISAAHSILKEVRSA